MEATTGWRFLVEELRAVGAVVHLAEPAETAALRGEEAREERPCGRRHQRELLLAGRLPESWIPPDHILDLRARVRLRHTLIEQHCEWQQRIQAVLYHHGCPQRRELMVGDGREWLAAQPLPATAREQITVSLAMIDAFEGAARAAGSRAARLRAPADRLQGADGVLRDRGAGRGHDPLRARRLPRFANSRQRSATAGWISPSTNLIGTVHPGIYPARGRRRCAGRCTRPPRPPAVPAPRTATTTAGRRAARRQPRVPGARAQAAQTLLPHAARARRRGPRSPHELPRARQAPHHTDAPRPAPGMLLPPRPRGRPRKTERPQRLPQRDHPIKHHVAGPEPTRGSWTEVRLGARAHAPRPANRAHAPPATAAQPRQPRTPHLTRGPAQVRSSCAAARGAFQPLLRSFNPALRLMPGRAGRLASQQHSSDEPGRVRGFRPFVARKEMWGRAPWPLGAFSSSGRAPQRRGDARREQRLRGSAPLPRLLLLPPASATWRRGSSQCRFHALRHSRHHAARSLTRYCLRPGSGRCAQRASRTLSGRRPGVSDDLRQTPARSREDEPSVGSSHRRRRRERAEPHGTLPAMRAIPRCSRQGDQVVAPGSTACRLLVEDDHGASGGTPIMPSPMAWRRASAARRRPLTGRACPDGRPGRGGLRWATLRTIRSDVRAWAPAFDCACGRRHAPGRRARVSSQRAHG